jgi:NADH-quinone oxidoreductase subunit G
MVTIFIDDKPIEAEPGTTVLKAAEQAGISIPHFCYHPAFVPEGTCRMCLVEIEGFPKLELGCSTQVREGMKIYTSSDRVIEARRGVLEFLLADHPLDCPICDQAGECKLQDYFEEYGLFESRCIEAKEKRDKKTALGKSLLHDQERCVLCRRCVRFLKEVSGTQEMGVFERGIHTEVNIYEGTPVNNNYSGNLAQLCPVGAITDKDFRFQTRSWFLKQGDTICPLCSRGCAITIDSHKGFARFPVPKRVYRIRARENPDVNGFWICDRGRYGYDIINGLREDKLRVPDRKNVSWDEALDVLVEEIKPFKIKKSTEKIAVVYSTWLTNEELFLIDRIFGKDMAARLYRFDPKESEGDDILLTPERTPNRRGAREMGMDTDPVDLDTLAEKTEILLLFGASLADHFSVSEIKARLEGIPLVVLFNAYPHEINDGADLLFPTALFQEKGGSAANTDGLIQVFAPALEPTGSARPEWRILVDLGKKLNIDYGFYRPLENPADIFQALKKEFAFFGK